MKKKEASVRSSIFNGFRERERLTKGVKLENSRRKENAKTHYKDYKEW